MLTINDTAPAATTQASPQPLSETTPAPASRATHAMYDADAFEGTGLAVEARIMAEAAQKNAMLSSTLSRGASKALIGAKQGIVAATARQIAGEQTSAITKLAAGGAAMGANAAVSAKGTSMRQSPDGNRAATGAGLDAAAQGGAVGNVINQAHDLTDKYAGGTHEADQAKLELKEDDVAVSVAQQQKDSAQAGVTQAQKQFDDSLAAFKNGVQRWGALMRG